MDESIKKKRGRRRKCELIKEHNVNLEKKVIFKEQDNIDNEGQIQEISFGNINIFVKKNKSETFKIDLKNNSTNLVQCLLSVSKKELDEYNIDKYIIHGDGNNKIVSLNNSKKITILKHFEDISSKGEEIKETDILCFNCSHSFTNQPCFLPYDYCYKLKRYKLFGNFCSPNCAKSYALNSKTFSSKVYLIGDFYRKLYNNSSLKIKPAPTILCLKCFGGTLTIDQFRENFDNNVLYTLNKVNAKIKPIDLIIT